MYEVQGHLLIDRLNLFVLLEVNDDWKFYAFSYSIVYRFA